MKQISNKIIRRSIVILFLAAILITQSCYYNKEELLNPGPVQPVNCSTAPASFSADVLPLIMSKCAYDGCHNATAAGGVILLNYSQVSEAKERIKQRVVIEKTMPPPGPLLPAESNILKCWIENGAPNN